jgi:hypothetical protein
VTLEVPGAEAGGEEEWAEERGEQSGYGVRDEEEAVVDELAGVAVRVGDDGVLGEYEDGDGGEADGDPEAGLARLLRRAGGAGVTAEVVTGIRSEMFGSEAGCGCGDV